MTPGTRGDQRRIDRDAEHWFGRMHAPSAPEDIAAFERWYQKDDAHRQAYDALLADYDEFGLIALTETGRQRRLPRAAIWQRRPVATATTVGVGALAILAAVGLSVRDNPAGHAAPSNPVMTADAGTPRTVVLGDGSSVTLAAGARMTNLFSATRRELQLNGGKARFHVAHGDPRPFVVVAAGGRIIAHGTVFDVDRGRRRVHVNLLQGSISIIRPEPGGKPIRQRLLPGQQLDYPADENARAAAAANNATEAGMIVFAATRLDEASHAIEAASRRRIVLDPALSALRISGAFRRGDAEGFAAAVSAIFRCQQRPLADGSIALERLPLG